MKIRKLIAATDVKLDEMSPAGCSISAKEDYVGAIDCIQSAINLLAHTLQCNKEDIVARESIANLAVVLLDLKSSQSVDATVEAEPAVVEVVEEDVPNV